MDPSTSHINIDGGADNTHTFKTKQNKKNKRKETALETPSPRRSFRFVNENVDIRFCQDRLGADAVTQMAFLLAQTCCTISSAPPPPCASARLPPLYVIAASLQRVPISFVCLLDASFVCVLNAFNVCVAACAWQ
eukprot:COSAG06_NODE_2872_length_6143_cov_2.234088_1_plen_135_part_00